MDAIAIVHCAEQMERSNADRSFGKASTLLGDLAKAEQLETTDAVHRLHGLLKSCSDDGARKTAKSSLSKWKRQDGEEDARGANVTEEPELSQRGPPPEEPELSQRGPPPEEPELSQRGPPPEEAEDAGVSEQGEAEDGRPSSASCRLSSVRSKCVQLLLAALRPEPPDGVKAAELAAAVERHVHDLHTSAEYKARVRSKVANLRNPKNRHLRRGLLSGALSPEAFARMSAEEMAGAELRQLREEYSSRGVSERQLPRGPEGTRTQKVRCKRCGGSDCRVTQVSRGALFLPAWARQSGPDEDAMTFMTCSGCGQQWYHSGWVCL